MNSWIGANVEPITNGLILGTLDIAKVNVNTGHLFRRMLEIAQHHLTGATPVSGEINEPNLAIGTADNALVKGLCV